MSNHPRTDCSLSSEPKTTVYVVDDEDFDGEVLYKFGTFGKFGQYLIEPVRPSTHTFEVDEWERQIDGKKTYRYYYVNEFKSDFIDKCRTLEELSQSEDPLDRAVHNFITDSNENTGEGFSATKDSNTAKCRKTSDKDMDTTSGPVDDEALDYDKLLHVIAIG
ncbi:uncharacterized protein L201_007921 [Kwoniella dendrophila CBS 6074]|uniref:Uncharacterized protein n=1 Tax=Kwoniella dendrophila CBS 6074 TaxID=1295534 RepID=A0AAX4K7A3_9TREE